MPVLVVPVDDAHPESRGSGSSPLSRGLYDLSRPPSPGLFRRYVGRKQIRVSGSHPVQGCVKVDSGVSAGNWRDLESKKRRTMGVAVDEVSQQTPGFFCIRPNSHCLEITLISYVTIFFVADISAVEVTTGCFKRYVSIPSGALIRQYTFFF